jgi:uncharacterized membrane protein YeaQ/YmgE (transglycosylase-associated protein family)
VGGGSSATLERSMCNRFLLGAILGTLAFVLCQYFVSHWWAPFLINASFGYPTPHKWAAALGVLGSALFGISMVLPGVCAGLISGRRGFLVRALVGVVGSFFYGALSASLQFHSGALTFNARTWTAVFIFPTIYGLGSVVTSAVGGAAGQLLRSNQRLERP